MLLENISKQHNVQGMEWRFLFELMQVYSEYSY